MRAESAAWRSEPTVGASLLNNISTRLGEQVAQIGVLSEGTVTFSGDSGRVPITIENSLDRTVTVGVQLRASPAIRLESEPLQGIQVEPGKKVSVDIEARVVGGARDGGAAAGPRSEAEHHLAQLALRVHLHVAPRLAHAHQRRGQQAEQRVLG